MDLEEWFSNLAAHWDHLGISKTLEKNWCLVLSSRESDWSGVWLERTSQAALVVKNPLQETREMQAGSLGREAPLEEGLATHSSVLAWRIPWTEEPGELESRVLHSQTRLK